MKRDKDARIDCVFHLNCPYRGDVVDGVANPLMKVFYRHSDTAGYIRNYKCPACHIVISVTLPPTETTDSTPTGDD